MNMTTAIQDLQQTEGPHRPTVEKLIEYLKTIPKHIEVRAVAINGQTGWIVIEATHEQFEHCYDFNS